MDRSGNIGLLLIGLAAFLWAYAHLTQPEYQMQQLGEMARNQFLLDKNSGRIWQRVCDGESKGPDCTGEIMWEEMFVRNLSPKDSGPAIVHSLITSQQTQKTPTTNPK